MAIVFWGRDGQDHWRASYLDKIAYADGLSAPRIGNQDMPVPERPAILNRSMPSTAGATMDHSPARVVHAALFWEVLDW